MTLISQYAIIEGTIGIAKLAAVRATGFFPPKPPSDILKLTNMRADLALAEGLANRPLIK